MDNQALRKKPNFVVGVFVIRKKVNNRIYVGGSKNLNGAKNRNRIELKMKMHRNKKLLNDGLLHGEENFIFEIIDTVKPSDDPSFDGAGEFGMLSQMRN